MIDKKNISLYLEQLREEVGAPLWSRSVLSVKQDQVSFEREREGEFFLKVQIPGRPLSASVSLWPADQDSFCNCGSKEDPCHHIVASLLYLKDADLQSLKTTETTEKGVVYEFAEKQGSLSFERSVWCGNTKKTLRESLVGFMGGITSGRIREQMPLASRDDYTLDQLIESFERRFGILNAHQLKKLIQLLAKCASPVFLDGSKVQASPLELKGKISLRVDGNFLVFEEARETETQEIAYQNGAVLRGNVLYSKPQNEASSEKFNFPAHFPKRLWVKALSEVLPLLKRTYELDVTKEDLPELVNPPPRIVIHTELNSSHQFVFYPSLVYGDPTIAWVDERDTLELVSPKEIPYRQISQEKILVQRLKLSTGMSVRAKYTYAHERAAVLFEKGDSFDWQGDALRILKNANQASVALLPEMTKSQDSTEIGIVFKTEDSSQTLSLETLENAFKRGDSTIPLLDGRLAEIPISFLSENRFLIDKLLEAKETRTPVSTAFKLVISELTQEEPVDFKPKFSALHELLEKAEVHLPEDFTLPLRDYQKEGVTFLLRRKKAGLGAFLCDEMGLGKTIQALSILEPNSIILCPKSVLYSWEDHIKRFRPALSAFLYHGEDRDLSQLGKTVCITTYATFRQDLEKLRSHLFEVALIDESQVIKNPFSKTTQAVHALSAKFKLALTGTPIENSLTDLYSQFQFIEPSFLGTFSDFTSHFLDPIRMGSESARMTLSKLIKTFLLRRKKQDVLKSLPSKTETLLKIDFSAAEKELYETLKSSAKKEIIVALEQKKSLFTVLELLLRLRQVCCSRLLLTKDSNSFQDSYPSSKIEALIEKLKEVQENGHKAIIFSQWTSFLDLIQKELDQNALKWLRLDGSTRNRGEVVEEFQTGDNVPFFLVSLKAGGVGLTLTAADHVFLMDPWWNPAVEDQAIDRVHRIGQLNSVQVYRLVVNDSLEEKILALSHSKKSLSTSLLEADDLTLELTTKEILSLIE